MKRGDLLRHLRQHGCELLREGARHSWWHNPSQNKRTSVPRHNEIVDLLARKIRTSVFRRLDKNCLVREMTTYCVK